MPKERTPAGKCFAPVENGLKNEIISHTDDPPLKFAAYFLELELLER